MQLATHEGGVDGWATIHAHSFPFIAGNSPERSSLECPCGMTLGIGLYARQVLNVLIRCGSCSRLLLSPIRAPGQPIAGQPVYLSPGREYSVGGVVRVADNPVMMVGHDALLGYARETGRRIPGVHDPKAGPIIDAFDTASFLNVTESLKSLLGEDYGPLEDADRRGRQSPTPPKSRNRLVELVEFARETAELLGEGGPGLELNGDLLSESIAVLAMASRWGNHPAWPSLRKSLVSEAPHTIMLLTVASYLVDANNGVGVHVSESRQNQTTADVWIEPDLSQRVDLEVKTPLALRGPRTPISQPHAVKVIERALEKSRKQRRNTATSVLIVGGYHMGPSYDTVVQTAKAMLALERRKRGLAGILIADCTYESHRSLRGQETRFTPIARIEFAPHRGYRGDLNIRSEQMSAYSAWPNS